MKIKILAFSLLLVLCSPRSLAQEQQYFEQSELSQGHYQQRTRKIFSAIDPLNTDTVFFYLADLLESAERGELTEAQEVDVYLVMGKVFNKLNADYLSSSYTLRALEKYEDANFGPSRYLSLLYGQLAITFPNDTMSNDRALSYFRKALGIATQLDDQVYIVGNLNNLGWRNYEMGNLDSALHYYNEALKLYEEVYGEFHPVEMVIRENISEVFMDDGRYDEALALHQENYEIVTEKSFLRGDRLLARRMSCYLGMARAYVPMGNYAEAIRWIEMADSTLPYVSVDLVSEFLNKTNEIKIGLAAHTIKYGSVQEVSLRALSQKDSLHKVEEAISSKISESLANAQLDLANLRIVSQHQELRETKLGNKLTVAGLIIAVLLLTIGAIFLKKQNQVIRAQGQLAQVKLQNSRLKEEKLELQVTEQGQDLNELSGQMIFIRELIEQISAKLKSIENADVQEQKEVLNNLSKLATRNLQEIHLKGALQENLEKVNRSFYKTLDELSTNSISKGEKEIAALLRLGMSDLQISELRGTGVTAVRVAKTRIRQKLPMENQKDLVAFLMEI